MRSTLIVLAVGALAGCPGSGGRDDHADGGAAGCGNGKLDTGEQCDGANLDGKTCATQGFASGPLSCKPECTFEASACVASCAGGAATARCSCGGSVVTSGFCCGDVPQTSACSGPDRSIVPEDRRTVWDPGIKEDLLLHQPLGPDRLPVRTKICGTADAATYGAPNGTTDATTHIQGLLDSCPAGEVVYLPAGNYRLSDSLAVPSGVVLRGAGPNQTRLLKNPAAGGGRTVWMGGEVWNWTLNPVVDLASDAEDGATQLTVSNAAPFAAGDFVYIDQIDDTSFMDPEYSYGSRTGDSPWRTMATMNRIASVSGNVLTLEDPIHGDFFAWRSAQALLMPQSDFVSYAGVEELYATGGGQSGIINLNRCYNCWVKHVEANGQDVAGDPLRQGAKHAIHVELSYRSVVRDSYVHDASDYSNSTQSYGIVIYQTTNSLVENCISVWRNKPIQFQTSGGGNVIGYCYADNALDMYSGEGSGNWMEGAIDSHMQFTHHELIEGCHANLIQMDGQHGGTGWVTVFRNHATGECVGGTTMGDKAPAVFPYQDQNNVGIGFYEHSRFGAAIGNVVLLPTNRLGQQFYMRSPSSPHNDETGAFAFNLGHDTDLETERTTHLHLNYDYATEQLHDSPDNPVKVLPNSLYLTQKPAFFGASAWPWVVPHGATDADRVKTLPAKARFDAATPNGP